MGGAQGSADAAVGSPTEQAPAAEQLVRVVALDGPAGTGKSTVARLTAQALGWRFVDTGATYRAVTLAALREGIGLEDAAALTRLAQEVDVQLRTDPAAPGILLAGQDVSLQIRTAEVTAAVSAVSAVPGVRRRLIEVQRRAIGDRGAVVEGRDIATVVAPCAAVKVYLDARPEVRAQRRASELPPGSTGGPAPDEESTVAAVQRDLARRDAVDHQTNRLLASDTAVHLDTSELSLEQVVEQVVALARAVGFGA